MPKDLHQLQIPIYHFKKKVLTFVKLYLSLHHEKNRNKFKSTKWHFENQ
jgi:hypothetical protein